VPAPRAQRALARPFMISPPFFQAPKKKVSQRLSEKVASIVGGHAHCLFRPSRSAIPHASAIPAGEGALRVCGQRGAHRFPPKGNCRQTRGWIARAEGKSSSTTHSSPPPRLFVVLVRCLVCLSDASEGKIRWRTCRPSLVPAAPSPVALGKPANGKEREGKA